MREILFKAKRLDNGEWVQGDLIQDKDLDIVSIICWNYFNGENGLERGPFEHHVDPSTVCQYTGKTDKNGVKIFEGDICENDWNTYEIIHIGYLCGLYVREQKTKEIDSFDGFFASRFEVIGNIHD